MPMIFVINPPTSLNAPPATVIEANETEEKDRMEKDEKVPHDSSASTTKKYFGNLRASTEMASQVQVAEAAIKPIYPHAT